MPDSTDLRDSERDQERLKPDEAIIDLPEVKDIPGQEHIHPPVFGEMADTTISSGDEEGEGLLDDLNSEEDDESLDADSLDSDSDVSPLEEQLLRESSRIMPTQDESNLKAARLDSTDEDGEPLNEETPDSGAGLDVPGSELDDANEKIGEEDEENNNYSLSQN